MEQAKHTPGRWAVVETLPDREIDYIGETCVKAENGIALAHLSNYSPAERRANARLIAAAPELLAALYNMLEDGDKTDRAQALAAIRKATGSQQ